MQTYVTLFVKWAVVIFLGFRNESSLELMEDWKLL